MKIVRTGSIGGSSEQMLDAAILMGVGTGLVMLLCSVVVPSLQMLAIPGVALLVPSLLYGTR
jgi:hypothetical protein